MALPNTISTAHDAPPLGQSFLGPFKSSGGNYYAILADLFFDDSAVAFKATDPESTWSEQDASNAPTVDSGGVMHGIWCYPVADLIHVIFGGSAGKVYYGRFNMAADAWVDLGTSDFEILINDSDSVATTYVTIVVASDGDIYVGYQGTIERHHGTDQERVYWDKSTDAGVTWNGETHLRTASTANDFVNVTAILGLSDRIHYVWIGNNDDLIHRSLSSGDVLDTEAVADSNVFFSVRPALGRGDVHTVGADQRIRWPYKDGNGRVSVIGITSGANPLFDSDTDASDNAVELARGLCACIASRNGTAKESWLAYVHDTDRDLYVDVRDEPTEWGTDTEVHDAVDLAHVSCNVITNEAGDLVLGMIIQDATGSAPIQYTEHLIKAAPTALSGADFPDQNYYVGPYQI